MGVISIEQKSVYNEMIWTEAEKKFSVAVRKDIKDFLKDNNGGYPKKDVIIVNGTEYEVRVFLSLDRNDNNYCIEKPLKYFLTRTKGKIIPVAVDSGDNYYCVNNETEKVYYWMANSDSYYLIADDLNSFESFFK